MRRNYKADDKGEAAQLTTVIVKLENIGSDIAEIKNDMRNMRGDLKDLDIRIVKAEQQIKVLNNTVFCKGKANE